LPVKREKEAQEQYESDRAYERMLDILYAMEVYADKLDTLIKETGRKERELIGKRGRQEVKDTARRVSGKIRNSAKKL